MRKRYELKVDFETGLGVQSRLTFPVRFKFFGRFRARGILKRGVKYNSGKNVVYISPYCVSSVRLQAR